MHQVTHFIPLIGPFVMATTNLAKNGHQINTANVVSFNAFAHNESYLHLNNPGLNQVLVDEKLGSNTNSVEAYRRLIKDHNLPQSDLVTAVPPCAGLSLLNTTSSRGSNAPQNDWIYESIKYFLASDSKVFLMENAPGLSTRVGYPVLQQIRTLLDDNNAKDVRIHLTTTSTEQHGIPQRRKRTFLYLYRGPLKKFKNQKVKTKMLGEFLNRPAVFDSEDNPSLHFMKNGNMKEMFKIIDDLDLYDEISRRLDAKPNSGVSAAGLLMEREIKPGHPVLENMPVTTKYIGHAWKKADDNKGFWDPSLLYIRNYTPAIITKNSFRLVHPNLALKRVLSYRELIDLMGYPRDFQMDMKGLNALFQSVPVTTAEAHLKWALAIIDDNSELVETVNNINEERILIQNNLKSNLENTISELVAFQRTTTFTI